jgi:poly-gamma-glutamate capsule biosynthesis protein CapA/YwtB (metallophosphatase superfamily)
MKFLYQAGPGICLLACLVLLLAGCRQPLTRASTVTLALLGDLQFGRGVAQAHPDGDWQRALHVLQPALERASLALANLESPLAAQVLPEPGEGYNLCAPSESVSALTAAGIDLLSLANNHQNDCQANGAAQTRQILSDTGLTGIGPGFQPLIREVNGLKLAFLAFDDVSQALEVQPAVDAVKQAARSAKVVIVSLHWGAEYHYSPTDRQKALTQALVDAGADLIWGHHPHVLQPLEYIDRLDGQPPALAAYSLGNALFDQPGSPQANRSALLLVEIDSRGVQSYEIIPFEIDPLNGVVIPAGRESAQNITRILEAWLDAE